jgi:hypothetical protein
LIGCDVRPDEPGDFQLSISSEAFNMAYRKRVFLNPISISAPSFIQAVADSSDGGTYLLGSYVMIIGDCHRNIMLEFCLANAKQRKMSLEKIDRIVKVVNEFRDAIYAEARLIEKQKPEKQF